MTAAPSQPSVRLPASLLQIIEQRAVRPGALLPTRIAIRRKRHLNGLTDDFSYSALALAPGIPLLIFVALHWFRAAAALCLLSALILVVKDHTEFFPKGFLPGLLSVKGAVRFALALVAVPLVAPFLLLSTGTFRARRHLQDRAQQSISPERITDSDFDSRVECRGEPVELAQALELQDVSFEPVIIRILKGTSARDLAKTFLPLFLLFILLLFCLPAIASRTLGPIAAAHIPDPNTLYFCVSPFLAGIAYAITRALFPIYARIVPGRLDILTFSFGGHKFRSIEHYDLRTAKVEVDYAAASVVIEYPPNATGRRFDLAAIPQRHLFAESIMQAAISTAIPAPLPHDDLLG